MKIASFEDIQGWQKARELTKVIYRLTADGALARDFGLRDQMRRAAVSIMSNIAEGFERGGNVEFRHFLSIAKGSAGELRSQLYVARDAGFLGEAHFASTLALTVETSRLLAGLMQYLETSSRKGYKFEGSSKLDG
jgi:four helix bundle protein